MFSSIIWDDPRNILNFTWSKRIIWMTVTSHTRKTWSNALILLTTLNKVHRPFLLPYIRHLPTHEKRRPTLPQSRWLGVEPQGLGGALEGAEQSGPLWCLNQRPSRGREAFSLRLIPPHKSHNIKVQGQEREKRDTHTYTYAQHRAETTQEVRSEKKRNQLHEQTAIEEKEPTAGRDTGYMLWSLREVPKFMDLADTYILSKLLCKYIFN